MYEQVTKLSDILSVLLRKLFWPLFFQDQLIIIEDFSFASHFYDLLWNSASDFQIGDSAGWGSPHQMKFY